MQLGAPLARGSRSIVHEFGPGAVAKVPLPGTPEGWIRFEAIYTEAVAGCGVAVPRVLGIEVIDGRDVSIFERIDGPTMWDALLHDPSSARALGVQLAALHVQLLAVTPPITLPSQRARIRTKIAEAARHVDPSIARFAERIPEPSGRVALCHGDFHPKNIILSNSGPVVIDWFDASRGDAAADVARTSILMRVSPESDTLTAGHLPGASSTVLDALHTYYLDAVMTATSTSNDDIAPWRIVQIAARLSEGVERELLLQELTQSDSLSPG